MSAYRDRIREEAAKAGYLAANPLWIEAYMRLEHSTLDGLSAAQFRREVLIAIQCIAADGPENAQRCAESFGLR